MNKKNITDEEEISRIIKESIYVMSSENIQFTPYNYYKTFVDVAALRGFDKDEIEKFLYEDARISADNEEIKELMLKVANNLDSIAAKVSNKVEDSSNLYDESFAKIDEIDLSDTDISDIKNPILKEIDKIKHINLSLKSELDIARASLEKQKSIIGKIKEQAVKDALTDLYSRRYLNESLKIHLYNFKRYKRVFSILMVDLNDFKMVNDTYGHITGDVVLTNFAKILKKTMRKSDICIRYGGDEFIVILPETDEKQAMAVADKIKENISSVKFKSHGKEFKISISTGVTSVKNDDTVESILERVDKALYEDKHNKK